MTCDHCHKLQQRLDDLEARLSLIEEGLLGATEPLMLLGFTATESRIVAFMLKRDTVTHESLELLLGGYTGGVTRKNVHVRISHIRKKLAAMRGSPGIDTLYAGGYRMPFSTKSRIQQVLALRVQEIRGDQAS